MRVGRGHQVEVARITGISDRTWSWPILGLLLREAIDSANEKTGPIWLSRLLTWCIAPTGSERFRPAAFGIEFLSNDAANVIRQ